MTNQEFRKAIARTSVKSAIIGTGIFLFGVFIVWLILSGADPEADQIGIGGQIVIWVLAAICLFVGFAIVYFPAKAASRVRRGKHPLVNAIENGDRSYAIWFYEYVATVKGGGSDHSVWVFGKDGQRFSISARNADKAAEMLQFLQQAFPGALYGFSSEYEQEYKRRLAASR